MLLHHWLLLAVAFLLGVLIGFAALLWLIDLACSVDDDHTLTPDDYQRIRRIEKAYRETKLHDQKGL